MASKSEKIPRTGGVAGPGRPSSKKTAKKAAKKTASTRTLTKKAVTRKAVTRKAVTKKGTLAKKGVARPAPERAAKKTESKGALVAGPSEEAYRLPSADPEIRQLLVDLVALLEEKKLSDLRVINLEEVNPYFCFFVIVTASSEPQLQSIAREVAKRFGEQLTNKKLRPLDVESGWVIQDFVDIVLHIFLREQREYYNLEKLWGDAPTVYSSEEPRFRWPQSHRRIEG